MADSDSPFWAVDGIALASLAEAHDAKTSKWFVLVGFINSAGEVCEHLLPRSLLRRKQDLTKALDDLGAQIPHVLSGADAVVNKLRIAPDAKSRIELYRQPGWHGKQFILFNEPHVRMHPDVENESVGRPGAGGSFTKWKKVVSCEAACSSQMIFAICLAFAAPLLRLFGLGSRGVHQWGKSGIGKSTTGIVAASVYGNPNNFGSSWNGTAIGMEEDAPRFNDLIWPLDDTSKFKGTPQQLADAIQSVSYGISEGRSRRRSKIVQTPTREQWSTLIISCGEVSLADSAAAAGRVRKEGEVSRIIDIAADAGHRLGIFDRLPAGRPSHDEALKAIRAALSKNYGHAGANYVRCLSQDLRHDEHALRTKIERRMAAWDCEAGFGPSSASAGLVRLAYAAGRLASEYHILPLTKDQVLQATLTCHLAATAAPEDPIDFATQRVLSKLRARRNFQDLRKRTGKVNPKASGYVSRYRKEDVFLVRREKVEQWLRPNASLDHVLGAARSQGWLFKNKRGFSIQPGGDFGTQSFLVFRKMALPGKKTGRSSPQS